MDQVIYRIEGVGEYGLDPEHSPGVGSYYVKLYDGSYDSSGFDTEDEARTELDYLASAHKRNPISYRPAYYDAEGGSMCNGIGRDYF
jgi:hypothetical protein